MITTQDKLVDILKGEVFLLNMDILEQWESGAKFWGPVHSYRSQGAHPTVFSLLAELVTP